MVPRLRGDAASSPPPAGLLKGAAEPDPGDSEIWAVAAPAAGTARGEGRDSGGTDFSVLLAAVARANVSDDSSVCTEASRGFGQLSCSGRT